MNKNHSKIVLGIMFSLIIIIISILIFKPYITPLLTGIVFAYVFYPVYRWLTKQLKNKQIAAFIV